MILLSGCDPYSKLDVVPVDPTVIAVTSIKDSLVAISLTRVYVLAGKYEVLLSGQKVSLPPGIAIDSKDFSLHRFNIKEFMQIYQSKLNLPPNIVKLIEAETQ